MPDELKPCPFCESPARLETSGFRGDWYRIKCTNWEKPCVSFIDYADEAGRQRLIEKWNNRPIEQFLRQEIHDLSIECIDMGNEDALRAENAKLHEQVEAAEYFIAVLTTYGEFPVPDELISEPRSAWENLR